MFLEYTSLIIPTKDRPNRLKMLFESVEDFISEINEIIIVDSSSNENLEFDHIIPLSKGGANTYRNIQLLCESCNRSKSDNIG